MNLYSKIAIVWGYPHASEFINFCTESQDLFQELPLKSNHLFAHQNTVSTFCVWFGINWSHIWFTLHYLYVNNMPRTHDTSTPLCDNIQTKGLLVNVILIDMEFYTWCNNYRLMSLVRTDWQMLYQLSTHYANVYSNAMMMAFSMNLGRKCDHTMSVMNSGHVTY